MDPTIQSSFCRVQKEKPIAYPNLCVNQDGSHEIGLVFDRSRGNFKLAAATISYLMNLKARVICQEQHPSSINDYFCGGVSKKIDAQG